MKDKYEEPIIFEYHEMTAKVYRPILTDEERERRMEAIKKAAADLVISSFKRKGEL